MGQARPLIGHPDAAELADKIVKQNLSARAVEALVKSGKGAASSQNTCPKTGRYSCIGSARTNRIGSFCVD